MEILLYLNNNKMSETEESQLMNDDQQEEVVNLENVVVSKLELPDQQEIFLQKLENIENLLKEIQMSRKSDEPTAQPEVLEEPVPEIELEEEPSAGEEENMESCNKPILKVIGIQFMILSVFLMIFLFTFNLFSFEMFIVLILFLCLI